jgi:WD40 repeat protein
MSQLQDVFISYGRADSKDFARKLHDLLTQQGLEVWFDFDDIPLGVDYQNQIDDGIEKADNFVFVISPHAVNSLYCAKEIELALKYQKRIVPVLHVEQISRETWQSRLPEGTEADWQEYTEKGLHTSFAQMHPAIAKINWVYCREGEDDLDTALAGLVQIFHQDRSYVRYHTNLLIRALAWDRDRRQSHNLLVGQERELAEEWLRHRFRDSQPPCLPTDLHCEFITESCKHADNFMTQVFLSWAKEDRSDLEQIRTALTREGITLWVNQTDIKTGTDFQVEIRHGIERADQLIYLMSPDSIASPYCQEEIDYALSLNKRIVPLLIRPIDLEQVHPALRSMELIDFTDNEVPEDYQRDIDALIRSVLEEATYYEQHKHLLVKALKWRRQQQNPTLLLRGYTLSQATAWFQVAKARDRHPAILLQEQFLAASQRQPSGVALDVFICYSRRDAELARRLDEAIQTYGKTTWFDQESIAAGTPDYQSEIYRGIENANHFLFILSPSAIASPYCAGEVAHAACLNKRMITVLHQPVDPATLPSPLASVQWLDFSRADLDFDANLSKLLRTLDHDPEYLRTHTWLLTRALEWHDQQRDDGLLLRGKSLKEMCDWLLDTEGKPPYPTPLQRNYVTASNEGEIRSQRSRLKLQRIGLGVVSLVSLMAIGLGLISYRQYRQADYLKTGAQQEAVSARVSTSEALFQSDLVLDALLEAMRAGVKVKTSRIRNADLRRAVITALQQAVFWVQERQQITGHEGIIWSVSASPDGKLFATASADATTKVWQQDGTLVRTLPSDYKAQMLAVAFSRDGQQLAMADAGGRITLWQVRNWTAAVLANEGTAVNSLAFAADGTIAAGGEDGRVRLWSPQGKLLKTLEGHDAPVRSVAFSPDRQLLASASDDRTVRLWNRETAEVKTLVGHAGQVRSVSFSPDGQRLVSGGWDESMRVWGRDGTLLQTVQGHEALIDAVRFSPDGTTIASAGWDKTIKLWTLDGSLIGTLTGHSGQVRSLDFDPKDQSLLSVGGDRTTRRWQLHRPLLTVLQDHRAKVYSVTFSPNGQQIASAGADSLIRLRDRQGKTQHLLTGHQSVIWSVRFSPDGQQLVSTSSDFTAKLWSREGKLLKTLEGHTAPIYSAEFSPDGRTIATASADQTVRLWRSDGTLIRTLDTFRQSVINLRFSRDGQVFSTAGWGNDVQLWTREGKLIQTLSGHQGWVYDVSFSHDGQQILTGSYDNTARLWTIDGKLVSVLKGHEDGVVAVEFSPDDKLLATASHDRTIKLWRRDGSLVTTLRGHRDRVSDLSFSPDGKVLTTASEDQTVLLWNLEFQGDLDKLLNQGCQWTRSYLQTHLTDERWKTVRQFCTEKYPA